MMNTKLRSTGPADAPGRATPPWLMLAVLTLAYALAYLDRQVLTLLVEPMRATLPLSDTQIGLLQGAAFAVCFAVAGLPLGWLVDNFTRTRVIAACIAVWSLATSSTGLAVNYLQLIAARSATAVAEAGNAPASMSIFADLFAPRLLPRVSAIYLCAPYFGGGAALFLGARALRYFNENGGLTLAFVGHLAPWQSVFAVLAVPGLLLAVVVALFIREPVRQGASTAADGQVPLAQVLRFVARDSRYLAAYFAAYACILGALFSLLAWVPSVAVRSGFGTPASLGRPLGLIFLGCGVLGTLGSQWLMRGASNTSVVSQVMRMVAWVLLALLPFCLALAFANSAAMLMAVYAVLIFGISMLTSVMAVPLQVGVPSRMRGRVAGLFLLSVNLAGTTIGPALVGVLSDRMGRSGATLSLALVGVMLAALAAAFVLMRRSLSKLGTVAGPASELIAPAKAAS